MTDSVQEVAEKIRTGFAAGPVVGMGMLGSLAADKIEIQHIPALPSDGIWDGPSWALADLEAVKTLNDAIKSFRQNVELTVIGDDIGVVNTFTGALADGASLHHLVRSVHTVKNGKIIKSVVNTDLGSSSGQLLLKVLNGAAV